MQKKIGFQASDTLKYSKQKNQKYHFFARNIQILFRKIVSHNNTKCLNHHILSFLTLHKDHVANSCSPRSMRTRLTPSPRNPGHTRRSFSSSGTLESHNIKYTHPRSILKQEKWDFLHVNYTFCTRESRLFDDVILYSRLSLNYTAFSVLIIMTSKISLCRWVVETPK